MPGDLEKYREVRNWLVTQKSALNGGREVSLEPPDTSQLNKDCKEYFELALDGLRAYEWAGEELEEAQEPNRHPTFPEKKLSPPPEDVLEELQE